MTCVCVCACVCVPRGTNSKPAWTHGHYHTYRPRSCQSFARAEKQHAMNCMCTSCKHVPWLLQDLAGYSKIWGACWNFLVLSAENASFLGEK